MLNSQTPEKSCVRDYGALDVHSMFYTIQGEGPFAGQPAVFVRLAGCNLQCPFCDTDYTSKRMLYTPAALLVAVSLLASAGTLVVITGGEPFRQNLSPAIRYLIETGMFRVQIETNGTLFQDLPVKEIEDGNLTIVCSPKTGSINKQLVPYIKALKYVLHADSVDPDDGLPIRALDHPNSGRLARPPEGFSGTIYLQPIDDHSGTGAFSQGRVCEDRHLQACIKSCMKHGYTLGLQLHKFLELE